MSEIDDALTAFAQGTNCAQAVAGAFAPRFGLDVRLARAVSAPFGAGIAFRGEMCGAVSGAFMALGLWASSLGLPLAETKDLSYKLAQKMAAEFIGSHGSILCRDLLGCDLSTMAGRAHHKKHRLHATLCPRFVESAAQLAVSLMKSDQDTRRTTG